MVVDLLSNLEIQERVRRIIHSIGDEDICMLPLNPETL